MRMYNLQSPKRTITRKVSGIDKPTRDSQTLDKTEEVAA